RRSPTDKAADVCQEGPMTNENPDQAPAEQNGTLRRYCIETVMAGEDGPEEQAAEYGLSQAAQSHLRHEATPFQHREDRCEKELTRRHQDHPKPGILPCDMYRVMGVLPEENEAHG